MEANAAALEARTQAGIVRLNLYLSREGEGSCEARRPAGVGEFLLPPADRTWFGVWALATSPSAAAPTLGAAAAARV